MLPLDRTDPEVRKKEPLVGITPNGLMPALHDPNTSVKLWEVRTATPLPTITPATDHMVERGDHRVSPGCLRQGEQAQLHHPS